SVTPGGGGTFGGSASCTLSGGGTCSVGFSPSPIGTPQITATYQGAGIYLGSNGSTTLTVNRRSTSTSVSCTPQPDNVGQPATCTATVTDTDAGARTTPTGTVSWTTGGNGTF